MTTRWLLVTVVAAAMVTIAGVHIRNGMRFQAALARYQEYLAIYEEGKTGTSVAGLVDESHILMETEIECKPTRWGKSNAMKTHIERAKHFVKEDEYSYTHMCGKGHNFEWINEMIDARLMLEQSQRELDEFLGTPGENAPKGRAKSRQERIDEFLNPTQITLSDMPTETTPGSEPKVVAAPGMEPVVIPPPIR